MFATKVTFLKSMVLYVLTFLFRCSVYEMWSMINTQLMFFHLPLKNLKEISFLSKKVQNLRILAENYPTFTCLCRQNTFILKGDVYGDQHEVDNNENSDSEHSHTSSKSISP
jgi:hypothetical protein